MYHKFFFRMKCFSLGIVAFYLFFGSTDLTQASEPAELDREGSEEAYTSRGLVTSREDSDAVYIESSLDRLAVAFTPGLAAITSRPVHDATKVVSAVGSFVWKATIGSFLEGRSPESSMKGWWPIEIIINNRTGVDLEFEGYQLTSGKIWSGRPAPRSISAGDVGSFIASDRVPEFYGAEGTAKYKASDDSFRVVFYWNHPIKTGSVTEGGYTLLPLGIPEVVCTGGIRNNKFIAFNLSPASAHASK